MLGPNVLTKNADSDLVGKVEHKTIPKIWNRIFEFQEVAFFYRFSIDIA